MTKSFYTTTLWAFLAMSFSARVGAAEINLSDRVFFEQLQNATLSQNVQWLSKATAYPIHLKSNGDDIYLKSEADFIKNAKVILTPQLKSAIRGQAATQLFKNWQGVMIGRGEIWFSQVLEKLGDKQKWVYRITGINLDAVFD